MNLRFACAAVVSSLGVSALPQVTSPPQTAQRPVTDVLHGEELTDPYRWLEGDNSDPAVMGKPTEEVGAWTDLQNAYTRRVLDGLPGRAKLEARMAELMEVGSVGTPTWAGERIFYTKRSGRQAQSLLYVRDGLEGPERVLLDPFEVDASGLTSLDWYEPSPGGDLVAFGMSYAGDENSTLYVMDTATGEWLADVIPGKTSIAGWMPDGESFFYSRLEDVDDAYSSETRYHELGRYWKQDPVVVRQRDVGSIYAGLGKTESELEDLRTTWGPFASPSEDGRWLTVGYSTGTSSLDLWVADLGMWMRTGELRKHPVLLGEEGRHSLAMLGDVGYLQTYVGAPNGKIVMIDPARPGDREAWETVVPHRADATITGMQLARGVLVVTLLKDASTTIELYSTAGARLGELELPGIGTAGVSATVDRTEAFLTYTSFDTPSTIYSIDLADMGSSREVWNQLDVPVDGSDLVVNRVKYTSKDGTEVGMFVVHKRGISLDGNNPTLLYGYGGFNISMRPSFGATLFPWLEAGGVYAVANLRGGGEKGLAWHRAGQLDRKQNVFDDFIAAGEWLIDNGYTRPEKLAIRGGSNGGLLTGAAVTQRPDLFAAAIVAVPLLDMLRYQDFLMARFWVPEYGSAERAEQYPFLKAYSPYHNIEPGTQYPATLITAGENDTRVHPMHARKMAAAMQASTSADPETDPVLLWVDREGGHGGGKPLEARIRETVDQYLFVMWQTGLVDG
ncbi:MAG: prolyl oligopeptidase family serine peptidase [Planctomycetota bacterium]